MKLKELFRLMIEAGKAAELRSAKQVRQQLSSARAVYKRLPTDQKPFFDKERLANPYADSRVLWGDPKKDVRRAMVGIDIDSAELLLADRLNQSGADIDLVISHHPLGVALAGLDEVMCVQTDLLENLGLRADVAKEIMNKRIEQVDRRLHSRNHQRVVDTAHLLNIPLLCCHTPADNHVAGYLTRLFRKDKPKTLKGVLRLLLREPEYLDAAGQKAGPEILVGQPDDRAGKIVVDMTGGTEGSKEIFARLSQAGVNTLVVMHASEAHFLRVKNEFLNVINAGHMASDNLGMNLILDKLQKRGTLEIIECSGFRRFRRTWD